MVTKVSYAPLAILIAVVLIAAGGAGAAVYALNPFHHPGAIPAVQFGDNVTVVYTGYFASGAQAGKIFDTSHYAIATNNLSYPKSLEFSYRGSPAQYTYLAVHVGPTTPTGGYVVGNWTFGQVITGFWSGLVGVRANATVSVTIPVNDAYGPQSPGCLVDQPLTFPVAVYASVPVPVFDHDYPGVNASTGSTFTDPFYGWTDSILSANASWVSLQHVVTIGEKTSPYGGWALQVTNVTGTGALAQITVTNLLNVNQAGTILGHLNAHETEICSSSQFIVSAVNPGAGTYTMDFNPEVQGQSLRFVILVTQIFPGT